MATQNSWNSQDPAQVALGGTGAATLTSNGVLIGNGTSAITATTAGTTGQVLTGVTGSAPTFQAPAASSITITGNTGGGLTGNSFTFTGGTTGLTFNGAGTTETLGGDLVVANGGTGAATFTTNGVLIGNGTSAITATAAGTTGQVLTGVTGSAPTFQTPASSSITITGDSGGGLTGTSFTFTGGTTGLTFAGAGSTETLGGDLVVANGGTGRTTLTNHGVLVGAGTSAITQLAVGTNGQVLLGSTGADPAFGTLTSTLSSLTYTTGAASLNIDIANYADKTSWTPVLQFGGGSTGITYVTQTGKYSRIGNLVFIAMEISLSSKGSSTGTAAITGLPVTSATGINQTFAVNYQATTYTGQPMVLLNTATTSLLLYHMDSAANPTQLTNTNFNGGDTIRITGFYTA